MFRLLLAPGRNVHLCAAPYEVESNVQTDAGTFKVMVSQTERGRKVFVSELVVRAASHQPREVGAG